MFLSFRTRETCVVIFVGFGLFSNNGVAAQNSSKPLNPDISFNALGLLQQNSQGTNDRNAENRNGMQIQEAELQLSSDVDPYLRASSTLSVHREDGSADWKVEPEELFVETISLPVVTAKFGKFKASTGKHNQLHLHAFPFIDAPLINTEVFGEEGLNDVGVSVAGLLPMPWFSEVTVQAIVNDNSTLYNSPNSSDYAQVVQWRNLWDLNESATFEASPFGTTGPNSFSGRSEVLGGDFIFKWKPTESAQGRALTIQAQYLRMNREQDTTAPKVDGLATWVQYQFMPRWWAQGRAEWVGLSDEPGITAKTKQSALLGFFPSEFSGLRLQYDHVYTPSRELPQADHRLALQFNFSIGAHPAHAY